MPHAAASNRTFPCHMLREMYEQPEAIRQTISRHIDPVTRMVRPDRFPWKPAEVAAIRRVTIVASGASRHAGLCGKLMIEELAGIPVEVEHASEYGYRRPTNGKGSLVIAITQSGETADTAAAQRIARDSGMKTLSISNVEDSTISREADADFFTRAGKEVAIPATKSFTTQLTALYMLALYLAAQKETLTTPEILARVLALSALPDLIEQSLDRFNRQAEVISADYYQDQTFVFLGRGVHYPIALEGALKLKEISYVHAEGYPTGEFRHGPTALITETLPVVAIVSYDRRDAESVLRYEKSIALIEEIREISKRQILLASEGDAIVRAMNVATFSLPHIEELLLPIMEVVPLQFLAYHIAVRNGLDVDRPRNLVKSVTMD
ncbi:MAG TPA: isomerizing glutamine--fructose-6-phosphate transaminase [Candidatus Eisenbacteria bacterium]|nr:isomerizing glutamine--fructose-6-phosphate transaminase [Candidatus Eisenbacteria bacterium]